MKVYLNGKRVWFWWLNPEIRKVAYRFHERGSIPMFAAIAGLAPTLNIYNTNATSTETVPSGYSDVEIEGWGGGGGGGARDVPDNTGGGGGGGGGYTRCHISVIGKGGETFTVTIGAAAAAGLAGSNNTIVAGTITGFSNITIGGGASGNPGTSGGPGNGGAGGTPTNANSGAVNTTGNNGANGSGASGGAGGAGITGNVPNDGSPYGGGGNGGGGGSVQPGLVGGAVFYYTV